MYIFQFLTALLCINAVFSQRNWGQSGTRCDTRSCICGQEYIPFCGTDGVTYINQCQLSCAQNCDRGLRVKFEGVCPVPYVHDSGRNEYQRQPQRVTTRPLIVDNGYGRFPQGTRFPERDRYQPTTTPRNYYFPPGLPSTWSTTRGYGVPTVTPRYPYGTIPIVSNERQYFERNPPAKEPRSYGGSGLNRINWRK